MEETLRLNETGVSPKYDYMDALIDMNVKQGKMIKIIAYSILIVISGTGNIAMLIMTIIRKQKSKSRINTLVMHLAIADLFVTFLMMPLEIGWSITVSWEAGDAMCRIMTFFRTFGQYLSSFIIVCISIDRYYAVMRPLQILDVHRRGKITLIFAWVGSIFCSFPQVLVFHLEVRPGYTYVTQCTTHNTYPSHVYELLYFLFGITTVFWFPLCVMFYTYTRIFVEISRKSKEDRIRRSSIGFLSRARVRTLKMTITIIVVFIICWTPYSVLSLWYCIDRSSLREVDQRIRKALVLLRSTNPCMNPIIYGIFNIRQRNNTPK
ncbi:gonadotropin-releasing hormone II receptor-like isoform X1 [Odontomachus brunneus]|uniref:gonadotropin-releasing hormone II receptor-like isoform X1 n=1 Tax=Odontomachus brunneus TaxID=486640 RepID=UPI0013F1F8FB|nr:gonadotropin-releasing hormone II receptor-like isoform X1 [Odontomachus brunneus]XP_032681194.1 gonadotropin-releasing hormone II receptor-like isoform X1 [Odontomachus brunneus]